MTIYQLKKKIKRWQEIKKEIPEHGEGFCIEIARLSGVDDDIIEREDYYISLLRKAERAANDVIRKG